MADKKKKPNRFENNHPPVDPNDPAILITAGLSAPQSVQERSEEEEAVTPPVEEEKPAEQPAEVKGNDLQAVFKRVKATKKKRAKKNTHSLYLSDPVWNELVKRGDKEDMSPSEYLDELLKGVFEL